MNYINVIKTAFLSFPLLALLITIPYMLYQYHHYGSINKLRTVIIYSFILYLLVIYFLVILPLPSIEEVSNMTGDFMQLIPFNFINDIIKNSHIVLNNPSTYLKGICNVSVYTVVFNIFMTIPFGMYLRYYFKCSIKKTFLYSFLLSLFFELTQLSGLYFIYPRPYRLFDVDDLLTNTIGGVIGYYIMGLFNKILPTREEIDNKSIQKGMMVSGLRRITLFFFDILIFGIIYTFLYLVLRINLRIDHMGFKLFIFLFIIYYIIIPFISKGRTLGGIYLKVKIEYKNKIIGTIMRPIFLLIFYFIMPYYFVILLIKLVTYLRLDSIYILIIFGIYFIFIFILYLTIIIKLLHKKTTFYDRLFKITYKSLIINKDEDKI